MKKYFIVSDVHSFYDAMIKGLEVAGFDASNPNHIFVSLGDLFDRGDKACDCLRFVNSLPSDRKILIRGNHENCMDDVFVRGYFKSYDLHNKTNETIEQFYRENNPNSDLTFVEDMIPWVRDWGEYKKYESSLVYYYIKGDNIFVHGWVPYWCRTIADIKRADWIDWWDSVWDNGANCWKNGNILKTSNRKDARIITVFCGHVHSFYSNYKYHNSGKIVQTEDGVDITRIDNSPFIDSGIVCLDSFTETSGMVNVFVLTNVN